jgi:DNA modification methylase
MELNTIIQGDCLEVMRGMADKSVDILTDPPYGIGADKGVGGGISKGRKYKGDWDTRPTKEVFDEMLRVGKTVIIFGGNFFTDLLPCNGHWIVWDKTGEIKFNNPYSGAELAWTNVEKRTVKKYLEIQAGFIAEEKQRFHPTQKPVHLFQAIIEDYCGDIVFDPFVGSGTTAIAAKITGKNFIGVEINEDFCQIARERLKSVTTKLI